jgi:hypothetical protein
MKSKLLLLVIVLISFAGLKSQAQFKLGAGLAYATELNGIGISANGVYGFTDKWEGAATFTYYFKKDFVSWWSFDAAAHYVFVSNDKSSVYALGGLELLGTKVEIPGYDLGWLGSTGGGTVSDTNFGIVLGAGGRLNFSDKMAGFGELKLGIQSSTYIGLNAGLLFSL